MCLITSFPDFDILKPFLYDDLFSESEKACNVAPFSIGVSYGDTEKQKMDILMPDSLPTGNHINYI